MIKVTTENGVFDCTAILLDDNAMLNFYSYGNKICSVGVEEAEEWMKNPEIFNNFVLDVLNKFKNDQEIVLVSKEA